jgi:hypothetical protein
MSTTGWITGQEEVDFPSKLFELESEKKSIVPVVAGSNEDECGGGLR